MEIKSDIIIYFLKLLVMGIFICYGYIKMSNKKKMKLTVSISIFMVSLILGIVCTYIKFFINSFLSVIVFCFSFGSLLAIITKNKMGYTLVATMISSAICVICQVISLLIIFIPYRLINIPNNYLYLLIISLVQFILIYAFFKIKRFKYGFDFLYKRLNNDFADIIMINISVAVILITCLLGTIFDGIEEVRKNLLITFVILGFTMLVMIQKTLTMYYKQKLLENTLKEYKEELNAKQNEIENLKNEKFKISKITHEFYNRQKALELLVKQNINNDSKIQKSNVSKNVLNIINSLTEEYSEEFNSIKELPKLESTGITEIDSMFKYMQNECNKNNIEFKLKIIGNIHPLINNIIPKNKLETLIGDHIRDAINAVNAINTENKEILVILGIKNKKYELAIHDTGIDFTIETLLKLGKEAVTTNSNNGGSGIGFLTTFETLKQTKASLIITEQNPNKERYYSKSVIIRFDGKNQYKIRSYRAFEIKKHRNKENIIIEKT